MDYDQSGSVAPGEDPSCRPVCSHPVFNAVTYISMALIIAVYVITAAYILVNLGTISDQSGAGEAYLGLAGTVAVGIAVYFAVKSLMRCGRRSDGFDYPEGMRSGLAAVGWALPLMWVLSIAYILLITLLGADMGGGFLDNIPDETLAAELMLAGPEEEFIFRFLLIGVPMAVIGSMKGHRHL